MTRRRLADETGARVAALVLAARDRPYDSSAPEFASTANSDLGSNPPDGVAEVVELKDSVNWEQESLLQEEEVGWHKSVWKDAAAATAAKKKTETGDEADTGAEKEMVWTDKMVLDPRVASRMRVFELEDGVRERAEAEAEEKRKKGEGVKGMAKGWVAWAGWGEREKGGWEMGEVGGEDD